MGLKEDRYSGLHPDRKEYGTERIYPDPQQDDFEAMPENRAAGDLRKGYSNVKVPEHKPAKTSKDDGQASGASKPWKPMGRK